MGHVDSAEPEGEEKPEVRGHGEGGVEQTVLLFQSPSSCILCDLHRPYNVIIPFLKMRKLTQGS